MAGYGYFQGDEREQTTVSTTIDTSQFGELELLGAWSTIEKAKVDAMWNIGTGGSIDSTPVVHEDTIYFGACDNRFHAVGIEGRERWHFKTKAPVLIGESPAVHNGVAYFGSLDGNFYAVSLESGREVWSAPLNDSLAPTPLVFKGTVYFGGKKGILYAFSLDGKERWRFPVKGPIMAPIAYNNTLYFGSWDHNFYAVTLEGRLKWKVALPDQVSWKPVVYNEVIYVGCRDGNLYGISLQGKFVWRFQTKGPVISIPSADEDIVYFGSYDKNLYAVHIPSRKLLWKFETQDIPYCNPIIDNQRIYFISGRNYFCLSKDGKPIWKFEMQLPGGVEAALHKGVLYIGSFDCNLYAVDAQTGNLLWKFQTSMSTPSKVDVERALSGVAFKIVIQPPAKAAEQEKYRQQSLEHEGRDSQYAFKPTYIMQSKYTKGRKIRSMSSGWGELDEG